MPNLAKKKKNKKAFSLIELMIVIAIISIMTIVAIISLSPARTATQLNAAEREVASTIKKAQSYALQGKVAGGKVSCGFGIYFKDATNYEIFYKDGTGIDCASFNATPNLASTNTLESYSLKNGITNDSAGKKIYFTVPHGNIFNESGGAFDSLSITLKTLDNKTKSVAVGKGGNIEEK